MTSKPDYFKFASDLAREQWYERVDWNDGASIIDGMLRRAEAIEREKDGKALTEDEARSLKAAHFLRQIIGGGADDV